MIRSVRADIWTFLDSHLIVIPTNIGYKRESGANVMGRGLAAQAAARYPDLARWYGIFCKAHGKDTPVVRYPDAPLLLFPVKPLNTAAPWLSWKQAADLELIERSTRQLAELQVGDTAVPLVGCGNGGRTMAEVRPILDRHLSEDRFLLVLPELL